MTAPLALPGTGTAAAVQRETTCYPRLTALPELAAVISCLRWMRISGDGWMA